MALTTATRTRIEHVLKVRGLSAAPVRHFLCTQLMLTDAALFVGLVLAWFSLWPLAFALGAVVSLYSLWSLCFFAERFIKAGIKKHGKADVRRLVLFNLRLLVLAAVLYVLFGPLGLPAIPLLAGLSSSMISIMVWGLWQTQRIPAKEIA